jgi:hypothetical protein
VEVRPTEIQQDYIHKVFPILHETLTVCLLQPHDVSYYVSRRILAPPPLTLQKHTDPRAHGFAHSSELWRHHRLANVTCAYRWRLCGINSAITLSLLQCFLKYNVKGTRIYTFLGHRSHVFLIETCTSVIIRLSSHAHIMKRVAIIFTRYSTNSFIAQSKWSFRLLHSLHLFVLWYTSVQRATVLQRTPFFSVIKMQ